MIDWLSTNHLLDLDIWLLALALAADAFTIGSAVALAHNSPRQIFRLSFHFGLFQALFPLIGALLGQLAGLFIHGFSHWISFALLVGIGIKILRDGLEDNNDEYQIDPTRGLSLVMLSSAVSIDALAVGFSLGVQDIPLWSAVLVIGVAAGAATLIGMLLVKKLIHKVSVRLEIGAGILLISLGIKAVVERYYQ